MIPSQQSSECRETQQLGMVAGIVARIPGVTDMRSRFFICVAAMLSLLPMSAARAQSAAEFYKGMTVDLYIGYSVGGGYTWIGSANDEVSVCVAWESSGVTRFEDVLAKQLTVGSSGIGDDTYQFPAVLNGVLGTKFKIITGYPGGNDVSLALERGEVQGRCGWSWSSIKATRQAWVDARKMIVLLQLSRSKHPDLPNVPLVMDLAKTEEQRQIFKLIFSRQVMGRPYLAPPGLSPERAEALRNGFMKTMTDNELLAEAERAQFEITPVAGDVIDRLVAEGYATPAVITQKAAALVK
jgi:tripartite-type tricarboxylate transporter receptor subunit TctC